MPRIYLDNNATTPPLPEVIGAMQACLTDNFGNPSSGHYFGEQASAAMEEGRGQVARLLGCHERNIVFTSGGTEANNLAIWSAIANHPDKKHIISSQVEHASVLTPLHFLRNRYGYEVDLLPVGRHGELDLQKLAAAIRPDTALVSLMGANNENGVIWPLGEIGQLCKERSVLFHSDAVQMVGKVELDVCALHVDYLSMAAHKLHGPKGIGGLYVRRNAPLTPLIMGSDQESGRRAGTENVAGIVGFGVACAMAGKEIARHESHVATLRNRMEKTIMEQIPDVVINGRNNPRLANTLNVSFKHCSSAALIQELDEKGIAVSAHSACQSGDLDPSHVLQAMGVEEEFLHGTLRISLNRYTSEKEVGRFLGHLPGIIAKSRQGLAL